MTVKICPACSAEMEGKAVVCGFCGTSLEDVPAVEKEDAENNEAVAFPEEPGAAEQNAENAPVTVSFPLPEETAVSNARKKKKLFIILIAVILTAAAAAAVIAVMLTTKPEPDPEPKTPVGSWILEADGEKAEIIFYENGSGKITGDIFEEIDLEWFDGISFTWHIEAKKLVLDLNYMWINKAIETEYEIKEGKLYITFIGEAGEKNEPLVLRKKKASDDADAPDDFPALTAPDTSPKSDTGGKNLADSVNTVNEMWNSYYNTWSKEYSCTHIVIVKNNSKKALSVTTSSLAYDADGDLLGAGNSTRAGVIAPGCISFITEDLSLNARPKSFKTTVKAEESSVSKSVVQDIDCKMTEAVKGVVLEITNTGKSDISYLNGYVAFYKNWELVDLKDFSVSGGLDAGQSVYEQVDADEDFDDADYYFAGSR